jgi:hypothetical protein
VRASPGKQVNFHETPSTAEFECRNLSGRSQGAQRDDVHAKARCGLGDGQQFLTHVSLPRNSHWVTRQLEPLRSLPKIFATTRTRAPGEAAVVLGQRDKSAFSVTVRLIMLIP